MNGSTAHGMMISENTKKRELIKGRSFPIRGFFSLVSTCRLKAYPSLREGGFGTGARKCSLLTFIPLLFILDEVSMSCSSSGKF